MPFSLSLSESEREIALAISAAAFVNPFSDDRERFERDLSEKVSAFAPHTEPGRWSEGLAGWLAQLPKSKRNLNSLPIRDRELMRVVFLFSTYHQFLQDLDGLITKQLEQENSARVPFAKQCLEILNGFGLDDVESDRLFGIFYQLRRAHHFIVRGLKGDSASMKDFRRRLWNNVFTSDIRSYDQFLWNKMEDFSTLLLGETGSGKGTAAAAIGRSGFIPFVRSQNAFAESFNRTFIALNLAQFPESLLEAELFGYRKGAFTGAVESHDGVFARCSPHGAIFLDEIGEVAPPVQVKLLNVLQERVFSPVGSRQTQRFAGRVIAATNKNLDQLRSTRNFREDFFYRISSDIIEVPTLRQRLQESPHELDLLLESILHRLTGSSGMLKTIHEKIEKTPGPNYCWPGNVRELEQAIRRILLTGSYQPRVPSTESSEDDFAKRCIDIQLTAEELMQRYAHLAYRKLGTRAAVARRLELDPRTVLKYLNPLLSQPTSEAPEGPAVSPG